VAGHVGRTQGDEICKQNVGRKA